MKIIVPMHLGQRVLHALTDVELAQRSVNLHDPSPGVEEVTMRLAVLRKAIERAFQEWSD